MAIQNTKRQNRLVVEVLAEIAKNTAKDIEVTTKNICIDPMDQKCGIEIALEDAKELVEVLERMNARVK